MTGLVVEPEVHDVLGDSVLERLHKLKATPRQVRQLSSLFEVGEYWREGREEGMPCDGHAALCWPGRKVDRAVDAANHAVPPKGKKPRGDGPRERHRQYAYRVLSILRKLNLNPKSLRVESGIAFEPQAMASTLRGFSYGRAEQRKQYLRALVKVALDRGYPVAAVIDWLAGWGAPVDNSDPALYLCLKGEVRDGLPPKATRAKELQALWPRDGHGRILPADVRKRVKAKARQKAAAKAAEARTTRAAAAEAAVGAATVDAGAEARAGADVAAGGAADERL